MAELLVKTLWWRTRVATRGSDVSPILKEADASGTSPGKDVLRQVLEAHTPCVGADGRTRRLHPSVPRWSNTERRQLRQ